MFSIVKRDRLDKLNCTFLQVLTLIGCYFLASNVVAKPCDKMYSTSLAYGGQDGRKLSLINNVVKRGEITEFKVSGGELVKASYDEIYFDKFLFSFDVRVFEEYIGQCDKRIKNTHYYHRRYKNWGSTPKMVTIKNNDSCPSCQLVVKATNPETGEAAIIINERLHDGLSRMSSGRLTGSRLRAGISSDNFRSKPKVINLDVTFIPAKSIKPKEYNTGTKKNLGEKWVQSHHNFHPAKGGDNWSESLSSTTKFTLTAEQLELHKVVDHRWRLSDVGEKELVVQYMDEFKSYLAAQKYDKAAKLLENLMRTGAPNLDYLYLYARVKELAGKSIEAEENYSLYIEMACSADQEEGKYCSLVRSK